MKKHFLFLLFIFAFLSNLNAQITLTHNVGNTPIKTDWVSCEDEEYWARTFTLSEFGISTNEQFILKSGQFAISNAQEGARLILNVYSIDDNFPDSEPKIMSYGNYLETPLIGDTPKILTINFTTPIVVTSGIKKILIEVTQMNISTIGVKKVLIAGTSQDNDTSWFKGCTDVYPYKSTENLNVPVSNANFFINVTGEKRSIINTNSNVILSHNIGDNVIKTEMFSCTSSYLYWARKFNLSEFDIGENKELIINTGNVGITGAGWLATLQFNIYKVDENFPNSFSKTDLIGSSQIVELSPFSWSSTSSRIITIPFDNPVTVPLDVKTILVEVHKGISYGDANAFIAGTESDNDSSWFKSEGCESSTYQTTKEMRLARPNANFYITVNGQAKTIFPFTITNDNTCLNFSNNFSLTNLSEIKSVIWNFDDPSSGANNSSIAVDVNHQFSSAGVYNVTATVVHTDNTSYTIPKKIEIFDAPNINTSVSLKQCDNADINGFSFFNLNEVKEEIITNSDAYTITFFEEKIDAENNGVSITNVTTYKNEIVSVDKIWARVENDNGCYRVSEVNLLVSTTQIPTTLLNSFYECDNGTSSTDGIAIFNFSSVTTEIENLFPINQQLIIKYYRNEADALSEENFITDITNYQNIGYPNQQNIYIRVDSKFDNDCLGLGAHISLHVEKVPVANPIIINPACDNDRDGFFSFDTSTFQNNIIGNQTNVTISYFDENGTQLSSPLPNPFVTKSQKVTVKVENTTSKDFDGKCNDETILNFVVNSVPIANTITAQEECDDDFDGIISFNTATIESTILGNQTNLIVKYFDENDVALPSPLPNPFYTASQTITVRLENPVYDVCFEETTIDFIVREKPTVNLIPEDIICITNNSNLEVRVDNPNADFTYTWRDINGLVVGNSATTTIKKGGVYKVIATSVFGCNSEEQQIVIKESSISSITINDVLVQDDSDNNFIKVKTDNLGLGDYEFRLLDINSTIIYDYQSDPNFENLGGGIYILEVNDLNNCGSIPFEISLISFPSFFTPNGDGDNEYWQIKGLDNSYYKSGIINVFNRYGKQVATFTINDLGWDGTYNGKNLPQNDYWFQVVLINQSDEVKNRSGNFSLIRK
ncbi:T9SS type B sorting domain-containing protein [Polaribacter glomeratus]|uniref:PKD domain-containing protein n=1 Tax=Polaribacter glomeratus TaxID=102 RepID=A0A2S7WID6_9FLAO|nr:T9SS type B sorting domain-containing protein [Polaribacter glomeratus]PQJ77071.1 hypothetical protein BTO16_14565 [Polaribacter glomeratus]TXD67078.1 T9SS type B sorting domain-containing protein [Polaribacter glomeratus]